jgi:Doubled CXXCH motif (Paired_CXXCH_1)
MPRKKPRKNQKPKSFPILKVLVALFAVGVVLAVGGFAFAANQESHDPFCASCHTQPESTFLTRSQAAAAVDLASYHTSQKVLCINCHSRPGLIGRLQAELLGARNAVKFFTHTAVQPAVLVYPIGDANCLKCHAAVTQRGYTPQTQMTAPGFGGGEGGRGNLGHWHQNLARWQAVDPAAANCVTCHPGHDATGDPNNGSLNAANVEQVCNACHRVLRGGD